MFASFLRETIVREQENQARFAIERVCDASILLLKEN